MKTWMPAVLGCFALTACADDALESDGMTPPTEVASVETPAPAAPSAAATATEKEGAPPPVTAEEDAGDAGVPDVGADASGPKADGGKPTIPKPLIGHISATTNTPDTCHWFVDTSDRGVSEALDVAVAVGAHDVRCERGDGASAMQNVMVALGETTSVVLTLPAEVKQQGTLIAVAVGGSCTFGVNGDFAGSGATIEVPLPPGTYSVSCKPVSGATKSRSVTVSAGQTAMAMFKL